MFASFSARAVGLPDLPVATTIAIAADAGFEAVDLMIRDLVDSGADLTEVRRRLDDRGLRAGAFPMTMNWRGDEARFQTDLAALPRLAAAATSLGLTRTGTWVMPETPTMPPLDAEPAAYRAEVAALHVDRIGAIARVLAEFEIRLGLEVIGVTTFRRGVGVPFVTRLADLAPTLGELLDEPNVGLLVDTFHLYAAEESFRQALAWGADRIVWVHIADLAPDFVGDRTAIIDAERGLPGENGAIDCRAFLRLLDDAGFTGPVTAEPLARCGSLIGQAPAEVARRVKSSLDAIWPRVGS